MYFVIYITWKDQKRIIDRVHQHVCGHASFTDFKILLERNATWNDAVSKYVAQVLEGFSACRCTAVNQPSRKVSISSSSKEFNQIVCVDHFYLEGLCLINFMDITSLYSAVQAVQSSALGLAVSRLEGAWVGQFLYTESIQCEQALLNGRIKYYTNKIGIYLRPVPPRRNSRNPINSKPGIAPDGHLFSHFHANYKQLGYLQSISRDLSFLSTNSTVCQLLYRTDKAHII